MKCSYCGGIFVENEKISRILFRTDMQFSDETARRAELAIKQGNALKEGDRRFRLDNPSVLTCPKCLNKMRRQFFVYSYPVEIDRCISCEGVWFDKDEIEVLQYIYEHKEKFLDRGSF